MTKPGPKPQRGATATAHLDVRLTPEEKEHYMQSAAARGEVVSEVVRKHLDKKYGRPNV